MKENLKIETPNKRDNAEATKLFRELGYPNLSADEMFVYATSSIANTIRTISFDELRELARPKEYLNDKFELVVTNQPQDGFILVPDGVDLVTKSPADICFWKTLPNIECLSKDGKTWFLYGKDMINDHLSAWKGKAKILWQRENKVEAVKGRFLHQWAYEAFGRGEDLLLKMINNKSTVLQVNSAMGLHIFNDANNHFSLKPQTIQIGSRTINKPISVKPEVGQEFYVSSIASIGMALSDNWKNSDSQNEMFNRNLCHLTKEDAVNMTEATLELFAFQMEGK